MVCISHLASALIDPATHSPYRCSVLLHEMSKIVDKIFPHTEKRLNRKDPFWNGKKKPFAIATTASFVLLQLLFFCNLSYLYGAFHHEGTRVHNINVLLVDYDGGVIGESLAATAKTLMAPSFPSIQHSSPSSYPTNSTIHDAVRRGDYWAAVYTEAGASDRLGAALAGGEAAASYDASNAITWIWNEVRYATVEDGTVKSNIEELVAATRIAYSHINGTNAIHSMNTSDAAAVQVLLNPIQATAINIMPTTQGPRVFYNTVTMVLPIIMQFFYLMAINGISASFKFYSHLPLHNNGIIRLVLSLGYTLVGALCFSGVIWAFRESWDVGAGQFFLTWITFWLYMHINFLVMDVATGFIPASFLAFFVVTWVILNVTSTIFPFELNAGFYRWGYVLPAHEIWTILIQIWSGGTVNRLYRALPILFAWEIVLLPAAKAAMHHRCRAAARLDHDEEENRTGSEEKDDMVVRANSTSGSSMTATAVPDDGRQQSITATPALPTAAAGEEYFPAAPVPFVGALNRVGSKRLGEKASEETSEKAANRYSV